MADREDERGQLYGVVHARRHAPEGERRHHEGIQRGGQVQDESVMYKLFSLSRETCIY